EDFLQESEPPQPSDLVVEPGSNPFLEQFGEQAEPSPDFSLGAYTPDADIAAPAEFNASDWQPVEEETPEPDFSQFSPEATGSIEGSGDDAALIDFFQTESPSEEDITARPPLDLESLNVDTPETTDTRPPLDLESLNTDWQFENSYDAAAEDVNRPIPAAEFEPEFEPESDWQASSVESPLMESPLVESPVTPPDETLSGAVGFAADQADHEEPSQEALEEQLASFDMGTPSGQEPIEDSAATASSEPRSPWLFPLILLGISGWIVGLISFAFLWSKLSSPPTSPEPTAVSSPAPGTVAPVAAPTLACTPAAPTTGSRGIDLTSIQFQPNTANPQQVNVVGCLTNRTQKP
ncbi:MAG TPA: hypothetical protein V6C65_29025, partial [Allocoleopsis sp.]